MPIGIQGGLGLLDGFASDPALGRRNADRHSRRVGTREIREEVCCSYHVAMPIGIQGGLGQGAICSDWMPL